MSGTGQIVRQPRPRVILNGTTLQGACCAEVTLTNSNHASNFRCEIALGGDPSLTASWWADQSDIQCEIDYSIDGGQSWPFVFVGVVDHLHLDMPHGVIEIEGRDLSSTMIETKIHETFANKKSSEIATIIAGRHGLTAQVTPTSTITGRYYQLEHDKLTTGNFHKQTTEWDLLTFLAQQEGYAPPFVIGRTLYFQPEDTGNAQPMQIVYKPRGSAAYPILNAASDMRLERSLTLAKDIQVTAVTWNSKKKQPHTTVGKAQGARSPNSRKSPTQNYVVYAPPNATPEQVDRLVEAKLKELSRHERIVNFTMPGELSLDQRSKLTLSGTGTSFDQEYFIDTVERRMDTEGGFMQHVRCKNSSPRSEAAVL